MRWHELMLLLGGAITMARDLRAQQKALPVLGFLSSEASGRLNRLWPRSAKG
jgi:hypothetical protein